MNDFSTVIGTALALIGGNDPDPREIVFCH
jgi:hypothetical protein